MLRDNPFLIRELRQHSRRLTTIQTWIAGWTALLTVPIFLAFFLHFAMGERWPVWGTTGIQIVHAVLCMGVGLYGGYRVYEAEKANATLEAVLLFPDRPVEWLLRKIVPVLVPGLVGVLLALPIYIAAALLGMERMESLPRLLGQALMALAAGVCMLLLFPPESHAAPKGPGIVPANRGRAVWNEASKLLIFFLVPGVTVLVGAGRVPGPRATTPLFGVAVPLWPLWAGVVGLGLVSVILTAATPIGPETWERRAARCRLVSCALLFYIGAGALMQRVPMPALFLLLVLPLLAILLSDRFNPQRRSDPRSEQDLRRIAACSQNPVLLLDYRVQSRQASLLRGFLTGATMGIAFILIGRWFSGSWATTLRMLLTGGGSIMWIVLLTGLGGSAAAMWQREAAANALASLFLTPLTSREIVKGRMAAAWIRSLGGPLGLVLPLLVLPILVAPGTTAKIAAGVLAMAPLLVTTNLCAGFSYREKGMPRPPMPGRDTTAYCCVWTLHLLGVVCCLLAAGLGLVGKPGAVALSCVPAAIGFILHAGAARWMYELKVRRLEAIRQMDFVGSD